MSAARAAVEAGQHQWGLQLLDMVLDSGDQEGDQEEGDQEGHQEGEVVRLRGACLQQLAAGEVSGPGMNWYLTEDLVMRGLEIRPYTEAKQARILSGDIM